MNGALEAESDVAEVLPLSLSLVHVGLEDLQKHLAPKQSGLRSGRGRRESDPLSRISNGAVQLS